MKPSVSDVDLAGPLRTLARRIRALRELRGLTQEDFAARCGISVSFASLLERGERSPSYETLLQVGQALEIPLYDLFQDEADPHEAGAYRLVDFARERKLTRMQVDQLLTVARAVFIPPSAVDPDAAREPLCSEPGCGRPVL